MGQLTWNNSKVYMICADISHHWDSDQVTSHRPTVESTTALCCYLTMSGENFEVNREKL